MSMTEPSKVGRGAAPGKPLAPIVSDASQLEHFERLAEVLTWEGDPRGPLDGLEAAFRSALSERFSEVLVRLRPLSEARVERLQRYAGDMDDAARKALLAEPETCRRLVTRLHSDQEVLSHLESVFIESQSAVGHVGRVPMVVEGFDANGARQLYELVDDVFDRLAAVQPNAAAFVARAMRRLVLRRDPLRQGFASNSPQGRVGLARFTNPLHDDVDRVVLAEALVHEATHGFVGMSETIGLCASQAGLRWLADDTTYDGLSRTVSPWTGTPLDLPTYIHACFVWWGLTHLWSTVLGSEDFEQRRVRSRIARAAVGFKARALIVQLIPFETSLHAGLFSCLNRMASAMERALADSGLDNVLSIAERRV